MAERKSITVSLQVKELMYDITNKAYLTGKAREANGMDYKASSNMQASEDEENSYQLRRSLTTAFSGLKSILGEYLDENNTTTDNLLIKEVDNDGVLKLGFKMPSNFNSSSVDAMGKGIHAYLVDLTLSEWFAIANPKDAQYYAEHSVQSLAVVEKALYKRSRPERPDYGEFGVEAGPVTQ